MTTNLEFGIKLRGSEDFDTTGADEDKWVRFSTDLAATESATDDGTTEESETSLEVSMCGIIEFTESGDNEGYQSDEDTTVWVHDAPVWGDFVDKSNATKAFTEFRADSTDGAYTLKIYLSSSGATLDNGMTITANDMKFDIVINEITYTQDGTRLALCAYVDTTKSDSEGIRETIEVNDNDASEAVSGFAAVSTSGDTASFFNWVPSVDINTESEIADIIVTVDASSGNVYFTVDTDEQPSMISWDPTIGVAGTSSFSFSAASNMQLSGFAAMLLVLLAAFL
jgi:hypothetical protein